MSRQENLEKELALWQRRLQKRKEQKATFGISADPSLDIEIEDIEATIEKLQAELAELRSVPAQPLVAPAPTVAPPVTPIAEPDPKLAALRAKPQLFLCHASEDKARVKELYHQLKDVGYRPWLDKFDLLPGQKWRPAIKRIITDPYNLVLVCFSNNSITKRGVVQQEIKWALDILEQMPEGTIYLIPVRLEKCPAPDQLADLHWVDLFEPDGFEYLTRALDYEIGKRQAAPEPAAVAPVSPPSRPPEPKPAPVTPIRGSVPHQPAPVTPAPAPSAVAQPRWLSLVMANKVSILIGGGLLFVIILGSIIFSAIGDGTDEPTSLPAVAVSTDTPTPALLLTNTPVLPVPTPTTTNTSQPLVESPADRPVSTLTNTPPTQTDTVTPTSTPTRAGLLPPSARMTGALIRVGNNMGFSVSDTPYLVAGMPVGRQGSTVNFNLAIDPSMVVSATVEALNINFGLALLKPKSETSLTGVPLASSKNLKLGEEVHLYSLNQGFVEGKVEALDAVVTIAATDWGNGLSVESRTLRDVIQTSSVSVGGDIGTPLFDANGQAVGVVIAGSQTTSVIVPMEQLCQVFWNYLYNVCQ